MKITFPHMGSPLIYTKLFELLGHEVIVPAKPTRHTIDLGVKYSPEFACYPLKVITGTYLEAIAAGADTVVTSGGNGPCRAGYYGEVHKVIMENLGKDVEFIIFDEPKKDIKGFINNIKRIKGSKSWLEVYRIIKIVYRLAQSFDKINKEIQQKRAYIIDKNRFSKFIDEIEHRFRVCGSEEEIMSIEEYALGKLAGFSPDNIISNDKLRIGVIGEIYVVMEPEVNFNLIEILNNFGAEVELSHYISHWIEETLIPFNNAGKDILQKGKRFIEIIIGGHAKQSVGHIVDYQERGFDGVIHLKPFGCLPELITQSMLDNISEELDIPILSLSIDEQMATANVLTRVEAFIDMIKQKKEERSQGNERDVSGY